MFRYHPNNVVFDIKNNVSLRLNIFLNFAMMFSANNLKSCLKQNPPLVLFTIVLVFLTIACFSFAFSIKYASLPELKNTDLKQNWITLKKHFNKLFTYVHLNETSGVSFVSSDFADRHSVYSVVKAVGLEKLQNISYVHGILTLKGWISNCPVDFPKPDFMVISFMMPPKNQTHNETNICVELIGPKKYLPVFSEPACNITKHQNNNFGVLMSINLHAGSEIMTNNGVKIKLEFDTDLDEDLSNHLTAADVTAIYTHLMYCSYFLTAIVACVLLYAFYRGSDINEL